ncbi:electron transfer flavoprotein subunit alpha/FixB family protein [Nocardioides sp.]|uniref:electron transfer flavoprotein subunit alpha/FixB family protein n=1 Tax=Nocardioides sp. TaxID=35761 RepID=UPI003D107B90
MSEVLVLVDDANGVVRNSTFELLALAKRIGSPSAVFVGAVNKSEVAAEALKAHGADKVYVVDDAVIKGYLVAPKVEVMQQLVERISPAAILVTASAEGKEIAGRLSIKLSSGLITDAVDVRVQDGSILTTQSVFAGNFTVEAEVTRGTPIIAVKPNAASAEHIAGAGVVEPFAAVISEDAKTARIVASQPRAATGRPELTEATVVVSGGRGTGGDFACVEGLADVLGAAVGASRAAVDSGWYPHTAQVGQTGKVVSPQVYIAGGVSGAIQHLAGMQTSKMIVAVNTDEEAPIFEHADLGVVGDMHVVLPAVAEAVGTRQPTDPPTPQ